MPPLEKFGKTKIVNATTRAYIQLHIAVFAYGFTAILGDLISLSALNLVWWRVLITSVSLLFLINAIQLFKTLPRKRILQFMGIGVLVGLHWICFYGAIKLANASISLVCMATSSFFAAFLEPLLTKERIKGYQVALGLLIIPGMALVVNGIQVDMMLGVWVGLAASVLATLFGIFNKVLIDEAEPYSITFLELGSAWLFLSLLLPFFLENVNDLKPTFTDWGYLLVLSLICTTLAFALSLKALKHLSAFASALTINLEPVYGILLAYFMLNDSQELSTNFYIGVVVILLAVFAHPYLKRKLEGISSE